MWRTSTSPAAPPRSWGRRADGTSLGSLLIVVGLGACALAQADSAPTDSTIKVMTYNLRYASPLGENSWPVRRPILVKLIEEHSPDILGTQEGLYGQLKDLESHLPAYRWIGVGREGGSRGEFMAVFYKADRLEPLEFDHFWLSDTPETIGSRSWGNNVVRMVTWIKFRDRSIKQDFYFVNTHFDHQNEEARRKSADLLLERIQKLGTRLPVIVTGDFNAAAEESEPYRRLVGADKFRDSWTEAEHVGEQVQTFNGFHFPARAVGPRIDWILLSGPIHAERIQVDPHAEGEQYPSDHFPVIATLRFGP